MTIAELVRLIESKKRIQKAAQVERASFDYALADLIGRSVSRVFNSSNKMPEIYDVYPSLFEREEIDEKRQEKIDELSALRFRDFAQSFNQRFKKEVGKV